ncbi:MAG: hypothetical protein EOO63_03795 [Hymenobacter sp.]|nr:MAG: hypothetical protein EOO63_03795 [Hymenobacter sp.]
MDSQTTRSSSVRQNLTKRRAHMPNEQEMQLLTSYVLGHLTLEEANDLLLLHERGRFIIAICSLN